MAGIVNPLIRRVLPDAERLANRAAGGFMPENVYHGTFENISSFRPGNPRAAQGSNIYTSTNPEDSSLNYARADGPDVRFRLAEEAYQMAEDAGGNPDIAQAIFDSLSPQQRNFYGTPEAWMATNPDLVGVAKDFVTGQMPSKGIVMPLAIRPGKIMDLTDAPTQTMMSDLPEDADDAFVEHVRDMSDYLPLREGTPAGLRNTFNSLRYDDPDASVRDFQQGLRREPIMEGAEAVDANDEFYNPTNEIFSRWASDLGFPTQKIDPQQEFGRMYADPMWRDTRHYITEPERLRSVNANFDPAERKSSDLLASTANPLPVMSSPEQLAQTGALTGAEDQGTVPNPLDQRAPANPLVQRPDLMTHPYREPTPIPQPTEPDPTEEDYARYGQRGRPSVLEDLIEDPMTMLAGLGAFRNAASGAVGAGLPIRNFRANKQAQTSDIFGDRADALDYLDRPDPAQSGLSRMDPAMLGHGSPHIFPPVEGNPLGAFDASKIGTGEGAQYRGYGHYLAGNTDVSKGYQNRLAKGTVPLVDAIEAIPHDTIPVHANNFLKGYEDVDKAITGMRKTATDPPNEMIQKAWKGREGELAELNQGYLDAADWVEANRERIQLIQNRGAHYNVDLPDEAIGRMVDLDAPLSGQSAAVQGALKNLEIPRTYMGSIGFETPEIASRVAIEKLGIPEGKFRVQEINHGGNRLHQIIEKGMEYDAEGMRAFDDALLRGLTTDAKGALPRQPPNPLGEDIYRRITASSDAERSEKLRALGIPGLKFYDQGSRTAGEGTRNYVVFPGEEKLLNILSRE